MTLPTNPSKFSAIKISDDKATTLPNVSAIADFDSTDGGVVLPRMTNAQEGTLTPTNGMIYYNSDDNVFRVYQNDAWADLATNQLVDTLIESQKSVDDKKVPFFKEAQVN